MDEFEKPDLCPICGGEKPRKNHERDIACMCTCISCSDSKEYD